jgi:ArsR family transcriptional regulator, lead/cadmium/zinc/bismuth-responsive transcriptional repressor
LDKPITFLFEERARESQVHLVDEVTAAGLAETFQALADPTRVRLISALTTGELCVYDLSSLLGMSQSAISHQLRILRALHLVRNRKSGRTVFYALDDEHIRDLFQRGLEHYQHIPQERLPDLNDE